MKGSPLVLFASNRDGGELKEEADGLETAIGEFFTLKAVPLVSSYIQDVLQAPDAPHYRIFHVRTHGINNGAGSLLLQAQGEEEKWMFASDVQLLLETAHQNYPDRAFDVVFFAACKGQKLLERCVKLPSVRSVVGYNADMPTDESLKFELEFYRRLKDGLSVEQAVKSAKLEVDHINREKIICMGDVSVRPCGLKVDFPQSGFYLEWVESPKKPRYLGVEGEDICALEEKHQWTAEQVHDTFKLRHVPSGKLLRWEGGNLYLFTAKNLEVSGLTFGIFAIREKQYAYFICPTESDRGLSLSLSPTTPFHGTFNDDAKKGQRSSFRILASKAPAPPPITELKPGSYLIRGAITPDVWLSPSFDRESKEVILLGSGDGIWKVDAAEDEHYNFFHGGFVVDRGKNKKLVLTQFDEDETKGFQVRSLPQTGLFRIKHRDGEWFGEKDQGPLVLSKTGIDFRFCKTMEVVKEDTFPASQMFEDGWIVFKARQGHSVHVTLVEKSAVEILGPKRQISYVPCKKETPLLEFSSIFENFLGRILLTGYDEKKGLVVVVKDQDWSELERIGASLREKLISETEPPDEAAKSSSGKKANVIDEISLRELFYQGFKLSLVEKDMEELSSWIDKMPMNYKLKERAKSELSHLLAPFYSEGDIKLNLSVNKETGLVQVSPISLVAIKERAFDEKLKSRAVTFEFHWNCLVSKAAEQFKLEPTSLLKTLANKCSVELSKDGNSEMAAKEIFMQLGPGRVHVVKISLGKVSCPMLLLKEVNRLITEFENATRVNDSRAVENEEGVKKETGQLPSVRLTLKSGQTWEVLLAQSPFFVPLSLSLEQLKIMVSKHLWDTPSAQDIVLAKSQDGGLTQLTDTPNFGDGAELFVFSSKTWRAFEVVKSSSASFDDKKRAVAEAFVGVGSNDLDFLQQLELAKRMSLKDDEEVKAGRERLENRAAVFGLRENQEIDAEGDCQFDAVADQLRKYQKFPKESKESVRAKAVEWIRSHAAYDLGNSTTVKQWVEALPENNGSFENYLLRMGQQQCWGDEVTLLAIIEAFCVGVVLISSTVGENNWYRTHYPRGKGEKDELPLLWLGHELERHYWSLVEEGDVSKAKLPKEIPLQTTATSFADDVKIPEDLEGHQRVAARALVKRMQAGDLADLHTHLLGMGDAHFWRDIVMVKVLPKLFDAADENSIPVEYSPTKLTRENYHVFKPGAFSKEFEAERKKHKNFTFDVVYTLDQLCDAFGVNKDDRSSPESQIGHLAGLLDRRVDFSKLVKKYTVYDVREEKFEERFGLTNTLFRTQILADERNKAMVQNCFEMAGGDNVANRFSKKELFLGKFNPQFYPRRYALKDAMYSQYPLVLDAVLQYMLEDYRKSGVSYVEFSVGVGDLIGRPLIYGHLSRPNFPPGICSDIPPLPSNVTFKYLAGFSRTAVDDHLVLDLKAPPASMYATVWAIASQPEDYLDSFAVHRKQLASVKDHFAKSRKGQPTVLRPLHEMCVGLDYFADEWKRPHCPFYLPEFLEFLNSERALREGHFGFRYHCGEVDEKETTTYLLAHMGASAAVINRIIEACKWDPVKDPAPLRIGHGTAFRHWLPKLNGFKDGAVKTKQNAAHLENEVLKALFLMKKHRIPIEVNLTSNDYLKGDATEAELLMGLLDAEMTVVMCTDNNGIWPTKRNGFGSVAGEFCGVIVGELVKKDYPIGASQVDGIVDAYAGARFGSGEPVSVDGSSEGSFVENPASSEAGTSGANMDKGYAAAAAFNPPSPEEKKGPLIASMFSKTEKKAAEKTTHYVPKNFEYLPVVLEVKSKGTGNATEKAKVVPIAAPFSVVSKWLETLENGGDLGENDVVLLADNVGIYISQKPEIIGRVLKILDIQVNRNVKIVQLILGSLSSTCSEENLFKWCLKHDIRGAWEFSNGMTSSDVIQSHLKKEGPKYYPILLTHVTDILLAPKLRCYAVRQFFSVRGWEKYLSEEEILSLMKKEENIDVLEQIILSLSTRFVNGSYHWPTITNFLRKLMLDEKTDEKVRYQSLLYVARVLGKAKDASIDLALLMDLVAGWRLCSESMQKMPGFGPSEFLNSVGNLDLSPSELKVFIRSCFSSDLVAPCGAIYASIYLVQKLGSNLALADLEYMFDHLWSMHRSFALDGLLDLVVSFDLSYALKWKYIELKTAEVEEAAATSENDLANISILKDLMLEDLRLLKNIDEVSKVSFTVGDVKFAESLFTICNEQRRVDRRVESAVNGLMHVCSSGMDRNLCVKIAMWCLEYCGEFAGLPGAHKASEFVKKFALEFLWPTLDDLAKSWNSRRGAIYCLANSLPDQVSCDSLVGLISREKDVELQRWMLQLLNDAILLGRKREYSTEKVMALLLKISMIAAESALLCIETIVSNEMPLDYLLVLTQMIGLLPGQQNAKSDYACRVIEKMLQKANESVFKELVVGLVNKLRDEDSHLKWYTNLIQRILIEAGQRQLQAWLESVAKSVDARAPMLARHLIERLYPQDRKRYEIWKLKK